VVVTLNIPGGSNNDIDRVQPGHPEPGAAAEMAAVQGPTFVGWTRLREGEATTREARPSSPRRHVDTSDAPANQTNTSR